MSRWGEFVDVCSMGANLACRKLKQTIKIGDIVKLYRDDKHIKATVCDIFPHTVLVRDLQFKDAPCAMCEKSGEQCERFCKETLYSMQLHKMCRKYWIWFHRQPKYAPTYFELLERGEE